MFIKQIWGCKQRMNFSEKFKRNISFINFLQVYGYFFSTEVEFVWFIIS